MVSLASLSVLGADDFLMSLMHLKFLYSSGLSERWILSLFFPIIDDC